MTSHISPREPAAASKEEGPALARLARALASVSEYDSHLLPRLRGPAGEELEVPETLFALLRLAVRHLERGDSVVLTPLPRDLSTFEAASLLDVTPAELDNLIERGEIACTESDAAEPPVRRIPLEALLRHRKRSSARRQAAIDDLTRMSQELGLYDLVEMPPQ